MFRPVLALVLATAAWSAAAAQTDTPSASRGAAGRRSLPVAGVITRPDWVSRPSGNDVARYYPLLAQTLVINGLVVIECSVAAEGAVENCKVANERPLGLGFGTASLNMASLFKMKPMTLDGVPSAGGVVRIPINFRTFDGPPPQAASDPAPAASAVTLGTKMAHQLRLGEYVTRGSNRQLELAKAALVPPNGQTDADAQALALDLAAKTVQQMGDGMEARLGDLYARKFTETDLKAITAFLDTPAGKALARIQAGEFATEMSAAYGAVNVEVTAKAREQFCAKVTCWTPDPPATDQGAKP